MKHRSDNQAVPLVLTSGSKKPHIHKLVLDIVDLCVKNSINLIPEWIPRNLNVISDFASKNVDVDDFMLNPDIFAASDILWGPHTIDHFSSCHTRQITRFNSRWPNPCSEGISAFAASWENENNWLFSPPKLIPRVLQCMKFTKSEGTLIAPPWESAPWWPLIVCRNGTFRYEVKKFLLLTPRRNIFLPAVLGTSMFGNDIPNFNTLALRLDFTS